MHVGKNQIKGYLEELIGKQYIRIVGNTIHITKDFFKLSIKNDLYNNLYETIYDYCLSHNTIPPYKDKETNDLGTIAAQYTTAEDLYTALKERCPKLPQQVSFTYLTSALCNKKAKTENNIHNFKVD